MNNKMEKLIKAKNKSDQQALQADLRLGELIGKTQKQELDLKNKLRKNIINSLKIDKLSNIPLTYSRILEIIEKA